MSASTAPSYLTEVLSTARAFCVVCGKVSDDLQLRGSGLKCKGCVGKRSNKHWVKLQKRQATQLLGEVSAPSSTMRTMPSLLGTSSPPPPSMSLTTPLSDEAGVSGTALRDRSTPTSSSVHSQPKIKHESISEYITGTSVFQKALHRRGHADSRSEVDDGSSPTTTTTDSQGTSQRAAAALAHKHTAQSHGAHRTPGTEALSNSSELSTLSSSARAATAPPAGGPPRRSTAVSKCFQLSHSSRPPSSTNAGVCAATVIHSPDIHIPRSRPSATSITPQVITPSSKDLDTHPCSGGPAASERPVSMPHLEAPEKSSSPPPTMTTATSRPTTPEPATVAPSLSAAAASPQTSTIASPASAATSATASTSNNHTTRTKRLPQRPSPGCVISVMEPERGGSGAAGAGVCHQRVISFSTQDGVSAVQVVAGEGWGENPLDAAAEPPMAPVAHSRCASFVSSGGAGTGARLPSRSPAATAANISPPEPQRHPGSDADDDDDNGKDREEDATDDAKSSATGSSSYVSSASVDASSHEHINGNAKAAQGAVEPPPPRTLNLDRLELAVSYFSPAQLAAESAEAAAMTAEQPANTATDRHLSSSRAGSQAQSPSASPSSMASSCSSPTQQRRSQVTVKGAFTVTRPLPDKPLHPRTRSTEVAGKASQPAAAAGAASSTSATTGQAEVRRLQFRFSVQDRDTGRELFHVDRGLFKEVMPALETVRKVAGSGSGLPPVPCKTLPSFRYATDAYIEERRSETEALARALVHDSFLVRHPALVKLLLLDPSLHTNAKTEAAAITSSPLAASQRGTAPIASASSGVASDRAKRVGGMSNTNRGSTASAVYLDSNSLDPLRQGARANRPSGSMSSQASGHSSSRSSVVRRSRLECVTHEDLEKVQIGAIVGRGSFGTVCQGYLQTSSGPVVVAVKRVHVDPALAEEGKGTLGEAQSELDILRKAKHKNVVRFLGSTFSPSTMELSVFTEYVECGTLASMVERFGCLPLLAIQKYMKQILEGLRHLHQLSIVHRDIKGENVLVTKNGRVKLTDFGSSGVLNEVGSASVMPMGSPLWMAPEILHGEVAEASGDIWAVGCVGIEMLDRSIWTVTPNDAVNPFVFMYRIGKLGTPPQGLPTREEVDGFKARGEQEQYECFSVYRDFLVQCLQVKPEDRWTADQLLQHPFIHTPFSRYIRWHSPHAKDDEKRKH